MHRRGFIKSIALVTVLVVVVGVVLYYTISPTVGWPSESRRVVHPDGFSIVMPLDWEKHLVDNAPGQLPANIHLLPINPVGTPGYFNAIKMEGPPSEQTLKDKHYEAATFQGQPAWEAYFEHKLTKEHTRSLIFERNGTWFEVAVRRPMTESVSVGVWQQYAESFRIEPVQKQPSDQATTMPLPFSPTTSPTTTASP